MIPDETLDRWAREAHERMASGFQSRVPTLIAEVRELRAERDEAQKRIRQGAAGSMCPDLATHCEKVRHLLGEAEKAEAELARIRALLADEHTVETVARALAHMEPGEDWPTNEALGGGLTGTRDDEFRDGMRDEAHAALDALAGLIVGEDE